MNRTLYGLMVSPWTERARWALEHHRIAYDYHEHVPMLGEVLLRMKARAIKATVPLLIDGNDVVMGSFEIAKHAERIGRGPSLFPEGKRADIERWIDVAERMMNVGRAWFSSRLLASKEAQVELVPAFVPSGLRRAFASSVALGILFLQRKYAMPEDVEGEVQRTLRPLLDEVRRALRADREIGTADVTPRYVLGTGTFSVVDMVLASTLHVLEPPVRSSLGPATREAWRNTSLASEYDDLIAWRDAIYASHR